MGIGPRVKSNSGVIADHSGGKARAAGGSKSRRPQANTGTDGEAADGMKEERESGGRHAIGREAGTRKDTNMKNMRGATFVKRLVKHSMLIYALNQKLTKIYHDKGNKSIKTKIT